MQYVNDDMDELFRRAAQDYPLNTRGADWEKLQKALEEAPAGVGKPARTDRRRHFLWLLLLLPLPWICSRYTGEGEKDAANLPAVEKSAITSPKSAKSSPEKKVPDVVLQERSGGSHKSSSEAFMEPLKPLSLSVNTKSHTSRKRPITEDNGLTGNAYLPNDPIDREEAQRPASAVNDREEAPVAISDPPVAADKTEKVPDSVQKAQDTTTADPPAKKAQQLPKPKRFYAGIIAGADVTSIEMQKVKKIGYDLGVVAGYLISDRWSVEAGLLSSEKAYYSSGEHLYKAYALPGTKLREAEGDCRMWEVPLVVRYRFAPQKQGGWFVSAGSSSYFMKKETYDYTYYYPATGQEVKRSRSYDSNSRHLFAAAQFSGGYTRRVGRSIDFRVEPYIKLPLRKVGYYELPLTSVGVHAGITKKLY